MARNHRPLNWDSRITVKMRSSTRAQLERLEPEKTLTEVIRDAIDSYLAQKGAQMRIPQQRDC